MDRRLLVSKLLTEQSSLCKCPSHIALWTSQNCTGQTGKFQGGAKCELQVYAQRSARFLGERKKKKVQECNLDKSALGTEMT